MKRILLIGVFFIAGSSSVVVSQDLGVADSLYANSLYGIAHPLSDSNDSIVPYALTDRQIKNRRASDGIVGVVGNLIVPGVGSMIIGDPHAKWIFAGAGVSALTIFGVFLVVAGKALNDQPQQWSKQSEGVLEVVTYSAIFSLTGFYIWGVVSPISYVRHKDYSNAN